MKKVFVTGGCGFIGSHLVRLLLENNHEVVVLDDLSTGSLKNLDDHPKLTIKVGSVLDYSAVEECSRSCDLVIHMASYVGMKLVYAEPEQSYNVSKLGTENVLKATSNVPIMLFSTSAVYGLAATTEVNESNKISLERAQTYDGPVKSYSAGKWELEQLGFEAIENDRNVIIIRPFNVIGERQSAAYGMVVPNFVNNAVNGMPLTIYDDGEQTRSFSSVSKFCNCIYTLLNTDKAWKTPNNVINIGSHQIISINNLAKTIIEKTGTESPIKYVPYDDVFPNKKDVRHRIPDTELLTKLIGEIKWPAVESIIDVLLSEHKIPASI